ncbi:MAG: ABC transporter permease [Synoicihabitans sp.]
MQSNTTKMTNPIHKPIHIRANTRWLRLDLAEVWHHRDLVSVLVKRDISARFRQTVLGPAWYVIQPLLFTVVFSLVFGNMLGISTGEIPAHLFYLSGLLCWNYFSQTLSVTGNSFHGNSNLFTKVYFPRVVVPISAAVSGLVGLLVQVLTFIVFYALALFASSSADREWTYSVSLLLFPFAILQTGVLAVGVGLWMSAITAKYRDLQHVLPLVLQLWLYLTPVAYTLTTVPEKWRWLAQLNPITVPIELCRQGFFGSTLLTSETFLISLAFTVFIAISGVLVFQKTERTFADIA